MGSTEGECDNRLAFPNGHIATTPSRDSLQLLCSVFSDTCMELSPGDLISSLRTPSVKLYSELRKQLKDPAWALDFVKENGIGTLLDTLKSLDGKGIEETQLKEACGQCLRVILDSRIELDAVVENGEYTQKLATALDTDNILVRKQVFDFLAALCVYNKDGYNRVLETLEHLKVLKKEKYRFKFVVEELRTSEVVEYTTTLVAIINCVIISAGSSNGTSHVRDRIHIRNEFIGLKILDSLSRFRKQIQDCKDGSLDDLSVQLNVFDEQRLSDESRFSGPDGVDLSSHMDVFFAILSQVIETSQETPFLSILQHLLTANLHTSLSEIVWETANTLVHRATLLESKQEAERLLRVSNHGGLLRCHCSCHYRPNTEDCADGNSLKRSRPNQLSICSDGTRTPSLLLSPSQTVFSPSSCEVASSPLFSCAANDAFRSPARQIAKQTSNDNHVPSAASCDNTCAISPASNGEIPSEKAPGPDDKASPAPPPPPPPPQPSGPPPPPPPPPLSLGTPTKSPSVQPSPPSLPQQNTPKPKSKMKSFNWSKIPLSRVIGKDNIWSRVAKDHTGSPNDLDFDAMEGLFCQQPVATNGHTSPRINGDSTDVGDKRKKEIQEINLLDGKRSLNINIFLKQFRSSHENIVRILEHGAHEELGAERLRSLLKILPEADEAEMLKNFDGDRSKLGNAEKFLLQLLGVPSYKLRVESMLLKEEFVPNLQFLQTSIETIKCAAQELEESKNLHEILYMVLVAGNFLNSGGYAGSAVGFKMLCLLKLTDIRANKPGMTLIHYVAEQARNKRPELLSFLDEVQNLEEATKISMETLNLDTNSLSQRVSRVSTQVSAAEPEIKSQMLEFVQLAEEKVEVIMKEINDLENVRQHLGDFFCEDNDTFKLEDCFKVFHNFCKRFKAALQENERRQKQEQLAQARKKQREEQMTIKRRSLELNDSRSNGGDHVAQQILTHVCNGFSEQRFGESNNRRSRSSTDPEKAATRNEDVKSAHLKRHSDPSMMAKSEDGQQEARSAKIRRARFIDEPKESELIGYLQKSPDADAKDRRLFGSAEDCFQDRVPCRQSGRKKRTELVNGDTNARERAVLSPPPPVLPTEDCLDSELSSKQTLKAKITNWMLQNEREQERDKSLQMKLQQERRKRQNMNGYVKVNNADLGETTAVSSKSAREKIASRMMQDDSFTQKIIERLNSSSSAPKTFERSRLYHSQREQGSKRHILDATAKDDCEMTNPNKAKDVIPTPTASESKAPNEETKNGEPNTTPKVPAFIKNPALTSNFDRSSPTRTTQRRLKFRERRIEAENANKKTDKRKDSNPAMQPILKSSGEITPSSPDSDVLVNVTCKPDLHELDISNPSTSDQVSPEVTGSILEGNTSTDTKENAPETEGQCLSNHTRSKSLRSRQSRLARRIDSLSTPLVSPSSSEEKQIQDSNVVKNNSPPATKSNTTHENEEERHQATKIASVSTPEYIASEHHTLQLNGQHEQNTTLTNGFLETTNDRKQAQNPSPDKSKDEQKIPSPSKHLAHKVHISTETKSKFTVPQSTQRPKPSESNARSTIPSVIKTTQNVKVLQTINRQQRNNAKPNPKILLENKSRLTTDSKPRSSVPSRISSPRSSSPLQSPIIAKKIQANEKKQTPTEKILNGKFVSKTETSSRTSSASSLNLNSSTKFKPDGVKHSTSVKQSHPTSVKNLTVNQNGSSNHYSKGNDGSTNAKLTPKLRRRPLMNSVVTAKCSTDTLIKKKENYTSERKKVAA